MADLKMNPTYTVYIISGTKKYNVTPALVSLARIDAEGQIAQRVKIQLRNVQVDGIHLSSLLQPVNRVFIYADDGTQQDEVFRGFLWDRTYKSSISDHDLIVTAYDHLIYLQESEDTFYFSSGKSTEDVITSICRDWGIKLEYSYTNIANGKLPLTGKLYDILTTDILDVTKKQTGVPYALISEKDTMIVRTVGSNKKTYMFKAGKNVRSATSSWTMEGIITQVVVIGNANDDERTPVELVESLNVKKYGTLQKIQRKDKDLDIWSAHAEARYTLKDHSEPKWEYVLVCPDVPWIRKGDGVFVDAGDINERRLIVTAVNRTSDTKNAEMTLTMVDDIIRARWENVEWYSNHEV